MSKRFGIYRPTFYRVLQANLVGGILFGLLFHRILPSESKFVLYLSSTLSALALKTVEDSQVLQEWDDYHSAQYKAFRELADMRAAKSLEIASLEEDIDKSLAQMQMVEQLIEVGRPDLAAMWREELQLPMPPAPPPEPGPPPGPLGLRLLEVAGTPSANEDFETQMAEWGLCANTGMVFVGNTGEGKTNAMHFALYAWLYRVRKEGKQQPVFYIFDIHAGQGREDDYTSTWLGLPITDKVPRTVSPLIFHGESSQIGQFLAPVWSIYKYRMKNRLGTSNGATPICVVIDEATSHMSELEKREAEEVSERLKKLKTGAEKFGIFVWVGTHDLTASNTGIPTVFFRNSELILGAKVAQSTLVQSTTQRTFAPGTLEIAAQALRDPHRNPKAPACFVTTLPVTQTTGILDTPCLSNKQMILEWSPADLAAESLDPHATFDKEFEEKHGVDPDDIPETPKPETMPKSEAGDGIKSRDLNKPTEATELYAGFRTWFQSIQEQHHREPTDDEIRGYWEVKSPGREGLTSKAVEYLRSIGRRS